jgi:CRP-like cAMP-binding protein
MARSTPDSHAPQQNHLLDALPAAEREQIYPQLQLVEMPLGKVVYEPGDLPRYAYFPTDCIVSLLYILEDGASTEISIVGNEGLITQMAQTVVCNRHHTVDQQLCRWLLLSLDRLPANELTMTHELIANMLGVRREGVTGAVSKLQRLGVINHSRGHITVLDRPALEQLSCECYAVVKRETDRLLPYPRGEPVPASSST